MKRILLLVPALFALTLIAAIWSHNMHQNAIRTPAPLNQVSIPIKEDEATVAKTSQQNHGVTVNIGVRSRYVGLQGGIFDPGPVIQGSVSKNLGRGFTIEAWQSFNLQGGSTHSFGKETDVALYYARPIKNFNFNTSVTLINATPFTEFPKGDVLQISANISRTYVLEEHKLTPYVGTRIATPLTKDGPKFGAFPFAGLTHDWKPKKAFQGRLGIDTTQEFIWDANGGFGFDQGVISRTQTRFRWQVNRRLTLFAPELGITLPITSIKDDRTITPFIGVGVTFNY